MKGKRRIVLLLSLLSPMLVNALGDDSSGIDRIAQLGKRVIVDSVSEALKPNDANAATLTVASLCVGAGTALYLGSGQIAGLADGKVGTLLEQALMQNAHADDVLRGLGMMTAALGLTTLWKDGPAQRQQLLAAITANWCRHQMGLWATKEKGETQKIVGEAILALTALRKLKTVFSPTETSENSRTMFYPFK